jgi:hypothetical protein
MFQAWYRGQQASASLWKHSLQPTMVWLFRPELPPPDSTHHATKGVTFFKICQKPEDCHDSWLAAHENPVQPILSLRTFHGADFAQIKSRFRWLLSRPCELHNVWF